MIDIGIRHLVHEAYQIADAVAVHAVAQPQLRLDLIALSNGHFAHIVAEARDPHTLRVVPGAGRARPRAQAGLHIIILPVPNHHLALQAHAAADEAVLAVAV